MSYAMKPLSCDPARIKGMSEKLIISHYENNYGGAVKRLNAIEEQLAEVDYARAPVFLVNGLKREELVATNSMVLHELFFDGLGDQSEPGPALREAIAKDFGAFEKWRQEFAAIGKALGGGSGWVLLSSPLARIGSSTNGPPIIVISWRQASPFWRSICTSIPTTWISAPRPAATSTCSWTQCAGQTPRRFMSATAKSSKPLSLLNDTERDPVT